MNNYYSKYIKYKKKYLDLQIQKGSGKQTKDTIKKDCSNLESFKVTKKNKISDTKMIKKGKMRHFTDEEIQNYTLIKNVNPEVDCYLSTKIKELEPALYMYVAIYKQDILTIIINPNIFPPQESKKEEIIFPLVINHSNLYKGEPTNCGGLIKINKNKKISYIDNQSGHYSPDFKSLKCIVKLLHRQFPNCLDPDLVIMNWNKETLNLEEVLEEVL
tara:strand:- start:2129 stop:2776 length:648 start_codon:yes stop_codon:yes gene_type:complete